MVEWERRNCTGIGIRLQQSIGYCFSLHPLWQAQSNRYKSLCDQLDPWLLSQRNQRVAVDGITTEFIDINRGVPQGTVLGPILFSLMVNDIQLADPRRNFMVKFADDITISIPVSEDSRLWVSQTFASFCKVLTGLSPTPAVRWWIVLCLYRDFPLRRVSWVNSTWA